ncbi:MAG TPA: hypothetical protein VGG45_08885 [Terracidiphilus sp.]
MSGRTIRVAAIALAVVACALALRGQQQSANVAPTDSSVTVTDMQKHLDEMSVKIESMRQQLVDSQKEMDAMRAELNDLRGRMAGKDQGDAENTAAALRASVEQLEEKSDVLESEVKQHDQTKVESASKYPVRLSGTILFTSVLNSGATDNIDDPIMARQTQVGTPAGSLSATPRQTILGLDGTGPHFWGASSSAAVSVDFFGGIPYADFTTAAGLLRLRTAHATLAWPNRELTVAFDSPILTPRQPTSWVSVGEPALSWSGNLWVWSPQLKYGQDLPARLRAEIALIDPAAPGTSGSTGLRTPDPAESSRRPGYEAHLGERIVFGAHTFEVGAGGYYSRQHYQNGQHLDAWAATEDWRIVLASPLEVSGAFYRGRGIGGLGGGTFKDYVPYDNYTEYKGLDDEGGWAQVKWRLSQQLEANVAGGEDNAFSTELRDSNLLNTQNVYLNLSRNVTAYGNFVFRPRTYLLFSAEYREVRSWPISGTANENHILGLATGYQF